VRNEVRNALMALMDERADAAERARAQQICDEVLDEVFGLGPLEPLLQDPTISDILVNTHKQVYVERKGHAGVDQRHLQGRQHLLRIIDKIVSAGGPPRRRVFADGRRPPADGSRVNAIIPPLAVDGPLLSIRRFGTDKLMPDDLVEKRR
jgi:pilus assembly protein CpaF